MLEMLSREGGRRVAGIEETWWLPAGCQEVGYCARCLGSELGKSSGYKLIKRKEIQTLTDLNRGALGSFLSSGHLSIGREGHNLSVTQQVSFHQMAPIPTFSEETSGLILAARRIQADLIDVQVPRLRSCEGPLSLQQNLAAELREDIGTFEQQIAACHLTMGVFPFMLNTVISQELDLCIDDQPGVKSQAALRDVVAEFKDSLSRCAQSSFRAVVHASVLNTALR